MFNSVGSALYKLKSSYRTAIVSIVALLDLIPKVNENG